MSQPAAWPTLVYAGLLQLSASAVNATQSEQGVVSPMGTEQASEVSVPLKLVSGQARQVSLVPDATKVFVANPDIADIDASKPARVIIYGRKTGTTNVIMTLANGREHRFVVTVSRPLEQLQQEISRAVPSAKVELGETPTGLRAWGTIATPQDAATIKALLAGYLQKDETLSFDVRITSELQVLLQVKVAEVAKSARNFLGFNWSVTGLAGDARIGFTSGRFGTQAGGLLTSATGFGAFGVDYTSGSGSTSIGAVLDALKEQNLVSVLAEPNLTAISGSRASFVAGGEFPVPVVQGRADFGNTTIQWKEFGIKIDFTPTVIDEQRINIKVFSEVSELSQIGAVAVNGVSVPSLSIRKVDTTVELASGQSFAIAGLFKNNASSITRGIPLLSDIPVLGALFRSRAFLRDESELVVMITPYIVTAVSTPSRLRLPTDGLSFGNELEQLLFSKVERTLGRRPSEHLVGPGGFMLDDAK